MPSTASSSTWKEHKQQHITYGVSARYIAVPPSITCLPREFFSQPAPPLSLPVHANTILKCLKKKEKREKRKEKREKSKE